jgi:AcrR family transcriptional regulator
MEPYMPRTKEAFQQIRDERKQQILSVAATVFARRGVAGTKIEELALAAGISQGLLYRYFSCKEDVFAEILERAIHGAVRRAEPVLESSETPWNKLRSLTEQFLQGMSQEPMYYQLFSQALALPGRIHEIIEELGYVMDALRQIISEGQAAGQIVKRDPEQLSLLYLCCLYGLAAGIGLYSKALNEHFPDAEVILHILKS